MRIDRLSITDLRIIESAHLFLSPQINTFVGANGSGKTSVLEAAYLLGFGRSFRSGGRDALIRRGQSSATVFAQITEDSGLPRRLGIERQGQSWRGRVDDESVAQLSALFRLCAVCCFEPGAHELISGTSDRRRSLFDWGVFHVEPDFLEAWRRYQRALRQRNALIRERAPDEWFTPWEQEMASAWKKISAARSQHAGFLGQKVAANAATLMPGFAGARLHYLSGWKQHEPQSVDEAIERWAEERLADRERGFTRRGPHRSDWQIVFDELPRRDYLSRGQEKISALIMVLSQMDCLHQQRGDWPVLLLDDLASELDAQHQQAVLHWVSQRPIQVLLTGVTQLQGLPDHGPQHHVFHVEQGRVTLHR